MALWHVDLHQVLAIFVEGSPAPHTLGIHEQVDHFNQLTSSLVPRRGFDAECIQNGVVG